MIFKMYLFVMTFGAPVWILAAVVGSIIKKTPRVRIVLAGMLFALHFVLINLLWRGVEFSGLPLWYPRLLFSFSAFFAFTVGIELLIPKFIERINKW